MSFIFLLGGQGKGGGVPAGGYGRRQFVENIGKEPIHFCQHTHVLE